MFPGYISLLNIKSDLGPVRWFRVGKLAYRPDEFESPPDPLRWQFRTDFQEQSFDLHTHVQDLRTMEGDLVYVSRTREAEPRLD